jgi:hypothetical protein
MSASYLRRCAGKGRHADKAGAAQARKALAAAKGLPVARLTVYRCDQCLSYHVGNAGRMFVTRKRRPGKRANRRLRGR